MAQAQLGFFVFAVGGAEYSHLTKQLSWRWAQRERIGALPARQYLGPQPQRITLSGTILPENRSQLTALSRLMQQLGAETGGRSREGEPLDFFLGGNTSDSGNYLGAWVVDSITERQDVLNADGTPAKIQFNLSLSQYG